MMNDFEMGYSEFKRLRKQSNYHLMRSRAKLKITELVKQKGSDLNKGEFLFNLKEYYSLQWRSNSNLANLTIGMFVPVEMIILGCLVTFMDFENLAMIMLLLGASAIVIVSIVVSLYIPSKDKEHYYDFYYNIICEYIEESKNSKK